MGDDKHKKQRRFRSLGPMAQASSMGLHVFLSSLVGGAMGYFLDKWLATQPVFMILLLTGGFIAGFRQIIREAKKMNEQQERDKKDG